MTAHEIIISAQPHAVTVSSLEGLLKQTGTNTLQLTEALGINYRTAQRRIKEPETLTLSELWGLSAFLKVSEVQLLKLIRDEVESRLPADVPATAVAPAAPAKKKLQLQNQRPRSSAKPELINRRKPEQDLPGQE